MCKNNYKLLVSNGGLAIVLFHQSIGFKNIEGRVTKKRNQSATRFIVISFSEGRITLSFGLKMELYLMDFVFCWLDRILANEYRNPPHMLTTMKNHVSGVIMLSNKKYPKIAIGTLLREPMMA